MGNELDETTGPVNAEGRDVNVLDKQLKVEISAGTKFFDIAIWIFPTPILAIITYLVNGDAAQAAIAAVVGLLPGIIFAIMKTNALAYLRKLQQRIQADASQIDNYLEQRVVILENLASILAKSIDLDKDVMKTVAAYRGGVNPNSDAERNQASAALEGSFGRINLAFEAYPNLKAQDNIVEAMRQNTYLQKEITAARTLYNDTIAQWNQDIYSWPTKQIVAAKNGYTTRIPFTASAETKAAARGNFFA
jgi:LemA protein